MRIEQAGHLRDQPLPIGAKNQKNGAISRQTTPSSGAWDEAPWCGHYERPG
jgi:hypothetical protein